MVSPEPATAISAADELYRNRSGPESARAAVRQLERIQGGESLYDIQWRLARAMFLAGEDEPHFFGKGSKRGMDAVSLNPNAVEGHFWAGVNLALDAQHVGGIPGALRVLKARRHLQRAVSIHQSYHGAGPLRVLARVFHKTPRLLGGSSSRSEVYYDKAIELAPDNSVTLLYAAELALDLGQQARAIELLEKIVALAADPEWAFEISRDKARAQTLLKELTDSAGSSTRPGPETEKTR